MTRNLTQKKTVLITGISGFIGQHLARALERDGHRVIGFDLSVPDKAIGSVKLVRGNLVTKDGFDLVPWDELDAVFHLASAGVKPETRQWPLCVEVNILGTLNLLGALSSAAKCPTLIYTHSFYEDTLNDNPALRDNPYILTKSVASAAINDYALRYAGRVVDLKLFQIYGPGDAPTTVLPYTCTKLIAGEVAVLGSGVGLRDWIFIDDVVTALMTAMSAGSAGQLNSYDLGSGQLTSLREMVENIAELLGATDRLVFDPSKDRPDTGLQECASKLLPGWQSHVSSAEGLLTLVKHYKQTENK